MGGRCLGDRRRGGRGRRRDRDGLAQDQAEFAERVHLPFPLLSDPSLELATALGLPTFSVDGMTLYKRVTLVVRHGEIVRAFYPVFPPDRNAADVLAWLAG